MIQLIYSQLTGRVVQPPTVGVDPTARQGADPSFMGPNASTLLGQKIKESEMAPNPTLTPTLTLTLTLTPTLTLTLTPPLPLPLTLTLTLTLTRRAR